MKERLEKDMKENKIIVHKNILNINNLIREFPTKILEIIEFRNFIIIRIGYNSQISDNIFCVNYSRLTPYECQSHECSNTFNKIVIKIFKRKFLKKWNRVRRLGDTYYENELIERSITEKLGTRFLNGKEILAKELMDNVAIIKIYIE